MSGLILATGAASAASVYPADREVSSWAAGTKRPTYTAIGRTMGGVWVQSGASLLTYAVGRIAGHDEITAVGSDLIRAQVLNGVITGGLKHAINRARPGGGDLAFPSGHTSASFASATVLQQHYGWKAGVPAYALAGFVGWTRVHDNMHWLSDVIIGGTIGIVTGRAVTAGQRERAWTIAPVKTPGGVAILVSRK